MSRAYCPERGACGRTVRIQGRRDRTRMLPRGGSWVCRQVRSLAFQALSLHRSFSQGGVHTGLADVAESPAVGGVPIGQDGGRGSLPLRGPGGGDLRPAEGHLDGQRLGLLHQGLRGRGVAGSA